MNTDGRRSILSCFLIIAAFIKVIAAAINAIVRVIRIQIDNYDTAMLNKTVEGVGTVLIIFQIVVLFLAYRYLKKRLTDTKNSIVQEEQLLKIWAFALIVMQIVHELASVVYKDTMSKLLSIMMGAGFKMDVYAAIYIETHGLKYICMVTAIAVVTFVTAVLLDDAFLNFVAIGTMGLYISVIILFPSVEIVILGHELRIVWASVLYHLLETVGLICIAIHVNVQKE